ncbi:MAG: hypothetical protein B6D64_00920 [Bacteroidetes bacterium 4484_276]|nr:MAG: hypothetical protein B6D64_00920 [Bacteroidetes bacterium 4484_276]OYT13193.1 MAG: hypothetical protein B6I19_06380 [Bacteroidetes bacterium 4572_114]
MKNINILTDKNIISLLSLLVFLFGFVSLPRAQQNAPLGNIAIETPSGKLYLEIITIDEAIADGKGVVKIVTGNGITGAAELVHTDHEDASPVRISTPAGIVSWRADACGGEHSINYQGQSYRITGIGNQCWTAENLNVGNRINGNIEMTNNGTIEKYCYNNDPANCDTLGALYSWNEMMTYSTTPGIQGICPNGWHLPTSQEINTLIGYFGGMYTAGGKMKETGIYHWNPPNTGATDTGGFTALPGGVRGLNNGNFTEIGTRAWFWSSSKHASNNYIAQARNLYYATTVATNHGSNKGYGYSVRCVKN